MLQKFRNLPLVLCRSLHCSPSCQAVDKGSLGKLRKKTGFSFVNCKKALEKFDNDLTKAEEWLREQAQKEGWEKASKLQNRAMSQGLVSVVVDNNHAVIVEMNCETDFVARNKKFQDLVSKATTACIQHGKESNLNKVLLDKENIGNVTADGKLLKDVIAMEIGNIGENMVLRRAAYMKCANDLQLGSYVHSTGSTIPKEGMCRFGKYGSIFTFSQTESSSNEQLLPNELGQQLGQHIVGMNPKSIGEPDEQPAEIKDDETKLLFQEFLLDTAVTVKEFLDMNSANVENFVRFECGEELSNEGS